MEKKGNPEETVTFTPARGAADQQIGPYRLLQKLGEGGMGEVWVAEQQKPLRRKVALKLIKAGMDTHQIIARFESERQALAMMDHPAIAKVFEAGETPQGRPYFVMEYVQGLPITDYCDQHRLQTAERLALFMKVCEGVQHAHQKAIIHRDLKPSNILVTILEGTPVPKIIDFGVAKATARSLTERTMFTELGAFVGTPEYMSPEQAEMSGQNIDTRTDIYALGAILYELLVGSLPFDPRELRQAGFDAIRKKIREEDPPKPSTRLSTMGEASTLSAQNRRSEPPALIRQIRGDLDWITMKALEKDRTRRYGSPAEMAADIDRFLSHQPIVARPPSASYRARKFVRRHRIGVGAAGTLAIVLIAFSITTALQARRIARERDRANREAETSKQVSNFLVDLFRVSDPSEAKGNSVTAREILDKGADRVAGELKGQPVVQARLMETMGRVFINLGLYGKAEPMVREALKVRQDKIGVRSLEAAESLHSVGEVNRLREKNDEAEKLFLEALAIREERLGKGDLLVGDVVHSLGMLYEIEGQYDKSEAAFRREVEIKEKALGPNAVEAASARNSLAIVLFDEGKYAEAEPLFLRALKDKEAALGPDHPNVANTLTNLSIIYKAQRKYKEAEPFLVRAQAIFEKVFGPEHPNTASGDNNLAALYEEEGRRAEAETYYKKALAIWEKALGPDHSDLGIVIHNLANLYRNMHRYEDAEPLYKRSLAIWEKALGPKHLYVTVSLRERAIMYREAGRFAESEALLKRAAAAQKDALGATHPELAGTLDEYAALLRKAGRPKEAEPLEAQAKEIRAKNEAPKK